MRTRPAISDHSLSKHTIVTLNDPSRTRPCLPTPCPTVTDVSHAYSGSIFIDFTPKGGPKDLVGKYEDFGGVPGIVFPDGMTQIRKETCLSGEAGAVSLLHQCDLSEGWARECWLICVPERPGEDNPCLKPRAERYAKH